MHHGMSNFDSLWNAVPSSACIPQYFAANDDRAGALQERSAENRCGQVLEGSTRLCPHEGRHESRRVMFSGLFKDIDTAKKVVLNPVEPFRSRPSRG
jgi:hypothetical protein